MANILYLNLEKLFSYHKTLTAKNALLEMRNLKCKVYDDCIIVKELNEDMREISKLTGIELPEKIFLPLNR